MTSPDKIAVLMTCYNRKSLTLASLSALLGQNCQYPCIVTVYLVDDGSTDGTSQAIRQFYPEVKIISGNGSLYWNGGMRLAFSHAIGYAYDYHLWLNDDTILYPDAIKTLLETYTQLKSQGYSQAIVCGSTCDFQTGLPTSGGFRFRGLKLLFRFDLIEPSNQAKQCDTVSGNCVLLPQIVFEKLGNLNPAFTHYLGDLDYGLRVRKTKGTTWIAPGYIGTCSLNLNCTPETYKLKRLPQLWGELFHPKGLTFGQQLHQRFLPVHEWTTFLQQHARYLWPIAWFLTYRKLLNIFIGRFLRLY